MTILVRITAVSYLNTLPFIYGIEQAMAPMRMRRGGTLPAREDIALSLRIPSLCASAAIAEETDIALVPAAAIPLIPGFAIRSDQSSDTFTPQIITDYCIGAEGAVHTVLLLSDTPLADIRQVRLDSHSRTSVQLARVLAREYWRIDPEWIDFADCSTELAPGEAMVAIGDKVFALQTAHNYAYCYDLAQEWHDMTGGMPFVFAAWVACTPAGLEYAPSLNKALAYGVGHVADAITQTVNRSRDFDFEQAHRYLTEAIKFNLDDKKRAAMRLFWEKIITPG